MEVIAKGAERKLLLQISGELDHHGARCAMEEIDRAMDLALPLKTVLDLKNVSFMDSSGIAVIMRIKRRMDLNGGKMSVIQVPTQAKKVLDAAGLHRYVNIESEGEKE